MRNHPALSSFLEEKIAFRLRDRPIKASIFICSVRPPSEDRAPPTEVLVKPVRLLVRSQGEGPSHPEIVSSIGRGIALGAGKKSLAVTCASREKLDDGILLLGKGEPVVGSTGMQG